MIIAGAGGQAIEVLEILVSNGVDTGLFFFDNASVTVPPLFAGKYPILRTSEEVVAQFNQTGNRSCILGIGNPLLRLRLATLFESWGGELQSCISKHAVIGSVQNQIGNGATILAGAIITANVRIGKGVLLNVHCSVSHDSTLGDFVELSPGARVTGRCTIGDYTSVGTNACILPGVTVGKNVVIGAGAVVTKDVADNSIVAGVPAKVLRMQKPISD